MKKATAKILLITSLVFLTWHLGRAYEAKLAHQAIKQALKQSVFTDYFIPSWDEKYDGEIAVGNCFVNKAIESLCEYADLDY